MLGDISSVEHIYIACGHTDMRKSIDGLCCLVQQKYDTAGSFNEKTHNNIRRRKPAS
ncbi:IS66 family insertion sequence element accessory protein TnpB [Pectinatus sottacetonis]|uniref:IS66 family insertion sequence element accessory protein TnpB n=1 Tax=Pectinatus sottacetonis TaxID=1002795 RepID=UPI0018C4763F|nr:IS66 family insertion sequence element accessory protein TnpB [Pectinatus sottacetonis]